MTNSVTSRTEEQERFIEIQLRLAADNTVRIYS